jgi:hypothetical protein
MSGNDLHYVITVQWAKNSVTTQSTIDGVITPTTGATRQAVFRDILAMVAELKGVHDPDDLVVSHFSLEPNSLQGGSTP